MHRQLLDRLGAWSSSRASTRSSAACARWPTPRRCRRIVLVVGSVLVTIFGLKALGGWGELREQPAASTMFNLWKPLVPAGVEGTWAPVLEQAADGQITRQAWYFNGNFPWLGMLFCAPIIGLWYWCTDQYIVQRALGAPNEREARRGSIFAAFLKLLPVFIFIIPGMICFALATTGKNILPCNRHLMDGGRVSSADSARRLSP